MKRIFLLTLFILMISVVQAQSNITYYDTLYTKDFFCFLNFQEDTILTEVDANEKFTIQLVQKRGKGENLYAYGFTVMHARNNLLLSSVSYSAGKINQRVEYEAHNLKPGDRLIVRYDDEKALVQEDKYVKTFYIQSTTSSLDGKRKLKIQFYYKDQLIAPEKYTLRIQDINVSQYKFSGGVLEFGANMPRQVNISIYYNDMECGISVSPTCDIYNGTIYVGIIPEYKKFRSEMFKKLKLYDKTEGDIEEIRKTYPYVEVLETPALTEDGTLRYSIVWDNDRNGSCGSTVSRSY